MKKKYGPKKSNINSSAKSKRNWGRSSRWKQEPWSSVYHSIQKPYFILNVGCINTTTTGWKDHDPLHLRYNMPLNIFDKAKEILTECQSNVKKNCRGFWFFPDADRPKIGWFLSSVTAYITKLGHHINIKNYRKNSGYIFKYRSPKSSNAAARIGRNIDHAFNVLIENGLRIRYITDDRKKKLLYFKDETNPRFHPPPSFVATSICTYLTQKRIYPLFGHSLVLGNSCFGGIPDSIAWDDTTNEIVILELKTTFVVFESLDIDDSIVSHKCISDLGFKYSILGQYQSQAACYAALLVQQLNFKYNVRADILVISIPTKGTTINTVTIPSRHILDTVLPCMNEFKDFFGPTKPGINPHRLYKIPKHIKQTKTIWNRRSPAAVIIDNYKKKLTKQKGCIKRVRKRDF